MVSLADKNKDLDLLYTTELVKAEYVKATKAVIAAKARLQNARVRVRLIKRAMNELGYSLEVQQ